MRHSWLAVLILLGSCTPATDEATTTTTAPTPPVTNAVATTAVPTTDTTVAEKTWPVAAPRNLPAFDEEFRFHILIRPTDADRYAGPAWPTSLDQVVMTEAVREAVFSSAEGVERLVTDGFFVQPIGFEQFHTVYEWGAYDDRPLFITTDTALHFWHLVFAKVLRESEQERLLPALEEFLAGALVAARAQEDELGGSLLEDAASRAVQYYEAAAVLAGLDPGEIGPLARAEVELALSHEGISQSPVVSAGGACVPSVSIANCVDYSLFRPRGHYTRNGDLERYFRAMSMLGQTGFPLSSGGESESLRRALLVARPVIADPALLARWEDIYEPTAFLVGVADDFTILEAADAATTVAPGWLDDPGLLTDAALGEIAAEIAGSRPLAIDPEAASVRVMGARAVLDSYILDQLGYPNVGDDLERRVFVSALDVASVFGSVAAAAIQREAGEYDFAGYGEAVDRLRQLVQEREPNHWAGTVYDSWLSTLEALWVEHGQAFPSFMRTEAWSVKSLQTGLGSYAELKHDTILYAKQAFLAEGDGPPPPPAPPRHWVEPDPIVYLRLGESARLLQRGFEARSLLPDEQADALDFLIDMLDRFAQISLDELSGMPISEADNEWLGEIGSQLEFLWLLTAEVDPALGEISEADQNSALIADIARTVDWVLEVGTGGADVVYLLVPDDEGVFQVATGAVYSYHEFWNDIRLTDAEWQDMLSMGEAPSRLVPLRLPDGRMRPAWLRAILTR